MSQFVDIVNEQWDYAIILDACRYDYFETSYHNYISGTLSKKISPGSCTNQWRDVSFPDYYNDIVYITANPQINITDEVYGYKAGDHFYKIHEIWRQHWDANIGTVFPENVTNESIKLIGQETNKRFIIHFIQPHAPYLSLGKDSTGLNNAALFGNNSNQIIGYDYDTKHPTKEKVLNYLLKFCKQFNLLGNHPEWFLRKYLNLPPKAPMEIILRNFNKSVLRKVYQENLTLVLEQVKRLLPYLSGQIIVTADHGELLGENNLYSHPDKSDHPILREVPWLEIKKEAEKSLPNQTNESSNETNDDTDLQDKLKSLGYF